MDLNNLLKSQWDRTAAIALTVLGALFLLIGWIGISGTAYLAEQAPYIVSGGIGGVFLLGVGSTLWISADLRDEWRKLDLIEQALGAGTLHWSEDSEQADTLHPTDPLRSGVTAPSRTPRAAASSTLATSAVSRSAETPAKTTKPAATPAQKPRATRARPRTAGVAHES